MTVVEPEVSEGAEGEARKRRVTQNGLTLFRAEVSRLKAEKAAALSKLEQEKDAAGTMGQEKDAEMKTTPAQETM